MAAHLRRCVCYLLEAVRDLGKIGVIRSPITPISPRSPRPGRVEEANADVRTAPERGRRSVARPTGRGYRRGLLRISKPMTSITTYVWKAD
jgi:hypothetical protein